MRYATLPQKTQNIRCTRGAPSKAAHLVSVPYAAGGLRLAVSILTPAPIVLETLILFR
jgi:hypothetical protein